MKHITVCIGDVVLGADHPVAIQTMCNCNTNDLDAAFAQCEAMTQAGAQLIRLTTQGIREVESLQQLKSRLRQAGILTPRVADVHFRSDVALAAARVADKVRINPGNFHKDHQEAMRIFRELIAVCKETGCVLRIGINHGSLGERITGLYGDTAHGMVEAMKEWIAVCQETGFEQVVLSLKASNTVVMVAAYRELFQWMEEQGIRYPLHLGVTEAGNGRSGRIKSAVGLACLLQAGIGETIRVSLTENPVNELPVAAFIARYFADPTTHSVVREEREGLPHFRFEAPDFDTLLLEAACVIGPQLMDHQLNEFTLEGSCNGIPVSADELQDLHDELLQAARRRFTKCEYIACPSCGRTLFDIETTFAEVKRRTSHLQGLVIGVMGCIVNGPGEMADADYGYVGEGAGKVSIYRKKERIHQGVPQEEAIDLLLQLIEQDRQ